MTDRLLALLAQPVPLRARILRKVARRFSIGSYRARLYAGTVDRPWYGWCMYHAALEAKALGYKAMTVVEFGVAGGNGILCLCEHRQEVEKDLGIEIVILGFDTGRGLPVSHDPRDLLYCWPAGSFEMDRVKLQDRIAGRAELIIGDVTETVDAWNGRAEAPLGAVMFDLDLYSSTAAALGMLTKTHVLPRVWCYMDDICGYPDNAYTDGIGVREALKQFGLQPQRKVLNDHISQAFTFKGLQPEEWHQQVYIYHRLTHPDYNTCLSAKHQLDLDL